MSFIYIVCNFKANSNSNFQILTIFSRPSFIHNFHTIVFYTASSAVQCALHALCHFFQWFSLLFFISIEHTNVQYLIAHHRHKCTPDGLAITCFSQQQTVSLSHCQGGTYLSESHTHNFKWIIVKNGNPECASNRMRCFLRSGSILTACFI